VNLLGNPLTFSILKVVPKGIGLVTDETKVELRELAQEPPTLQKAAASDVHYEDIGGLGSELQLVREMIELPLRHPEIFERLGIEPPKGVLLFGPPGTGKTLIAKAVAREVDAHFITLSGPEIMSKFYGESEARLRGVFQEASQRAPAIIFLDEIDAIAPKRTEVHGEVERRVVAQLLTLMDGLRSRGQVVVIAATNIPDAVDPALRRGGRFDREIEIGIPDKKGRLEILQIHTRGVPLAEDVQLQQLANIMHGFVGADIALIVKEAAMHALRRVLPQINPEGEIPAEVLDQLRVMRADFEMAQKHVVPSAMREVLVEVPDVRWEDVGGLDAVKREVIRSIEWPIRFPKMYERLRMKPPKGILLFGPPGTGKTLIAKAIANRSGLNFISIKGPELLSKGVGDSEKHVREAFRRARQSAPAILFFDEIDSIVPKRESTMEGTRVTERVLSQILTELDGIEELKDVLVLAATNRPDMLDPAILRAGRLEKHIYIPPPDEASRRAIFAIYLDEIRDLLDPDVSIEMLVRATRYFVGADIEALVREAKGRAMEECVRTFGDQEEACREVPAVRIGKRHFDAALASAKGSLDSQSLEGYERLAWELLYDRTTRGILQRAAMVLDQTDAVARKVRLPPELLARAGELRDATYWESKDFPRIESRTADLESALAAFVRSLQTGQISG
jgi:transitional endoplasmic reticulum ATPase